MMQTFSIVKKQSGFGVLQLMVLMSITIITLLAMLHLSQQLLKSGSQQADLSELEALAKSIVAYVADETNWQTRIRPTTVNPSMWCLPNGGCTAYTPTGNPLGFALYDGLGVVTRGTAQPLALDDGLVAAGLRGIRINNANASWGYTLNGVFCATFSYTNPDPRCPAKFMVNWYATSNKAYPIVAITIRLVVNSQAAGFDVKTGRFSFDTGADHPGPVIYRTSN